MKVLKQTNKAPEGMDPKAPPKMWLKDTKQKLAKLPRITLF